MLLSRASRQCSHAYLRRLRRPSHWLTTISTCPDNSSPRWRQLLLGRTTKRRQSTQYPRPGPPKNTYPEVLNVFHSGSVPTVAIGLTRLVSVLAPFYGIIFVLPNAIKDASAEWWMPPAVTAITFVPLLASMVFGGYINAINIRLPSLARRSKEHLMSFAARTPPETVVEIKSMWFRPWPTTTAVYFGDLKRLPYSSVRLSNLEHIPLTSEDAIKERPWVGWMTKIFFGRYWVSRAQIKDRSRAPGAWDRMWEQIPVVGEENVTRRVPNAVKRPSGPPGRRVPPRTTKG